MSKFVMFALKGPESNGVTGGVEVYEAEFAKTLEAMGHQVEIYCGRDRGENDLPTIEFKSKNISVRRFNSPFGFLPFCMFPMHFYYLTKGKKDTDYVIENQSVFLMGTPFYKDKSIMTIIHHLTGSDFFRKQGLVKGALGYFAEKLLFPRLYRNQNILTVSNHSKAEITQLGIDKENITVIPPIVNIYKSNTVVNCKRQNIISYIGRYTGKGGNKRIDHVIEIFPKVLEEVPDARLIIGGSMKNEEELIQMIKKLEIEDKVEIKGFIDAKEKEQILSRSKVFASPSNQEGFGITYVEANSLGTPVVGYDIDNLDTVPSYAGIMVPQNNKDKLAEGIISLLLDETEWNKYSAGALRNASRFDLKTVTNNLQNYIREVTGG